MNETEANLAFDAYVAVTLKSVENTVEYYECGNKYLYIKGAKMALEKFKPLFLSNEKANNTNYLLAKERGDKYHAQIKAIGETLTPFITR